MATETVRRRKKNEHSKGEKTISDATGREAIFTINPRKSYFNLGYGEQSTVTDDVLGTT